MKRRMTLTLVLAVFLLIAVNCLHADSIWAKRGKDMPDVYADDVARQIGDTLTIIITEASKVDNKAKRDLKKEVDKGVVFNGEIGKYLDVGDFGLTAESTNELKSKADYKDERSFVDRVSVVVVDVLPNRNLVVMGSRSRDIAGDKQTIEVSGIVRPSDIAFDNTVKSEQVADFRIVSKNSGYADPYTRPGWFGRLLDIIWPF